MPTVVAPVLDDVYTALSALIASVVPTGVEIVQGIDNRVPMPESAFVQMTAIAQYRLRTNEDTWETTGDPTTIESEMGARLDVQIDCYGPDSLAWATMLQTLLRDEYACDALAPTCQPLYAEDPRMIPLTNGEDQYEQRWLVMAVLQYNPITSTPMQFADTLDLTLINVDEAYPP